MIIVRARGSRSWLDPYWQQLLGRAFGTRLMLRIKGEDALHVTLTYNRAEYDSPSDLYHKQRDQQHVPMFFRRLAKLTGQSFSGRWVRKMEFQSGGWVHFHVVIVGAKRIEHELLKQAWSHGHVFVTRMDAGGAKYLAKYVSKGETPPAFLLGERLRSVKIVAASPGFWPRPDLDGAEIDPRDEDPAMEQEPDDGSRSEAPMQWPVYRSIGTQQEINRRVASVEWRPDRGPSAWCCAYVPSDADLCIKLARLGRRCLGVIDGGMAYDADFEDVRMALGYASVTDPRKPGENAGPASASGGRGLHSMNDQIPDPDCSWPPQALADSDGAELSGDEFRKLSRPSETPTRADLIERAVRDVGVGQWVYAALLEELRGEWVRGYFVESYGDELAKAVEAAELAAA